MGTENCDTLLVSDDSGRVQLKLATGRIVTLAQDIESPTGIAAGADKNFYVCDDSGGGRLWKVEPDGIQTLVIAGHRRFGTALRYRIYQRFDGFSFG